MHNVISQLEEQTIPISWTQKHEDFWLVNNGGPNSRGEQILKENKLLLTQLWDMRYEALRAGHKWVKNKGSGVSCFKHEAQKPRLAETAGPSGFAFAASPMWAGAHRSSIQQPVLLLPKESEEDNRNAQKRMLKLTLKAQHIIKILCTTATTVRIVFYYFSVLCISSILLIIFAYVFLCIYLLLIFSCINRVFSKYHVFVY